MEDSHQHADAANYHRGTGVALFVERRRSADLDQKLAAANARLPHYTTYRAVMRPRKAAGQPKNSDPATSKRADDAR